MSTISEKQIAQLASIVTRYTQQADATKSAANAIKDARLAIFPGAISSDERRILEDAEEILHKIHSNSSQHDAVVYYSALTTQSPPHPTRVGK